MKISVKRVDHLGIVAGTIKDIGIIDRIDELLGRNDQEDISSGEVIAGMILNGLGFVSRPLMLTPQFFESKALGALIRDGITADHFNRHKIGRTLDKIGNYGCEKLFGILALEACRKENVDMRFAHADTTSYSLTGDYDCDSDTERIIVTHGHSKAQRPDLKQVVQELVTSEDGGIPFITKTWNGNSSDTIILRERAKKLMEEFTKSNHRYLVSDSKLYCQETAKTLDLINFITRVPSILKLEQAAIYSALKAKQLWSNIGNGYKLQEVSSNCYDIKNQRWIIVYSDQAHTRSKKTLEKAIAKEKMLVEKSCFHLQAKRFACEADAKKAVKSIAKKWKYHQITTEQIIVESRYMKRGKPKAGDLQKNEWQIIVTADQNKEHIDGLLDQRSCFVIATNTSSNDLSAEEVLAGYKGQDKTEKGFAFLKSPDCFVSSLFLKKPSRIEGLLMIMVLSLLVYSIAQRHLRKQLALLKTTLPNQINKPITTPTMRWIFQLFEGINYVSVTIENVTTKIIEGLNDLRVKVIRLLSPNVQSIYKISISGVDQ